MLATLAHELLRCQSRAVMPAAQVLRRFSGSTASTSDSDPSSDSAAVKALASKLLYRSKQRGFLELDLLVGLWAEKAIPKMDKGQLQHLAQVLDQENPDLFKWLTGQLPPPQDMLDNPVFVALRDDTLQQVAARTSVLSPQGKDWVRGWDDMWRKHKAKAQEPLQ